MEKINLNCGIYQIKNIITGFCYVGQSINLKERERNHWSNLKNNNCRNNPYLQNSYNKYGKNKFVFGVLIYCEKFELTRYEQFFVDKYKEMDSLYNICIECVDSCEGIKHTPETIEKMSKSRKGKKNPMYGLKGKNNPNYGRKNTSEIIEKMKKSQKGRSHTLETIEKIRKTKSIKKEIVLGVLKMLDGNMFQKNIAKKLNISIKTIYKVKKGSYNEIYDLKKRIFVNDFSGIKKEVVLKVLKLLDKNISVRVICAKLSLCKGTVYKAKNGYYNNIYDLKT